MDRAARLLVIDDTPQNGRLLEAMLTPHGYTVALALSGEEELAKLHSEPPDLVLLDILMPDMTGYDVCRRIREDPATQLLPVVMLTSSGDQDKVNAIEAGADDFISRPFNPQELLSRVRSLLRIKEYHDTIQKQTAELAEWNRTLEERVQSQVGATRRSGSAAPLFLGTGRRRDHVRGRAAARAAPARGHDSLL